MKSLIIPALVLGSPYWLFAGPPGQCDGPGHDAAAVQVINGHKMVVVGGDGPDSGKTYWAVAAGDDKSDGRSDQKIKIRQFGKNPTMIVQQVNPAEVADRENQGWLGVSIGSVPASLAAQLGTEGHGLMVQNVVDNSPADKAGFAPHDVIVSINGESVEAEVQSLVGAVSELGPGAKVNFVVLREGKEINLTATLGSRADQGAQQFEWKFEAAPDAEVEDEIHTRGRFMFRNPEGKWIMRDLGDIAEIEDLPDDVKLMLPEAGSRTVQVFVENGETKVRTRVQRDGSTIAVEQEGEEITVTRTDKDGNETTELYESEEELQGADEEAYNILKESGGVWQFKVDGNNPGQLHFDMNLDGEWAADFEWEGMQESLQRAQEAYHKAMEEFQRLHPGQNQLFHAPAGQGGAHMLLRPMGKPKHTFEVRTDGTIEVRIRKGDSELVQLYRNERDLAVRAPELAAKYNELMDAGD